MQSAKMQQAKTVAEMTNTAGRANLRQRETAQASDSKFAKVKENTFFKILFNPELAEELRPLEIAKVLTYAGTKEENRARVEEFNLIKEYLQSVREQMHSEIIRMSDPQNFAVLRTVMDEMNTALREFEDQIKPLTEILDALHILRTENMTMDAFREIQDESARKVAQETELAEINRAISEIENVIGSANSQIASLSAQRKSFIFGGGIKEDAQYKIKQAELEIKNNLTRISDLGVKATDINARNSQNSKMTGELINAKEKLGQLLSLDNNEHETQSRNMIQSAIKFIEVSKEKTSQVHDQLGKMDSQIRNLTDSNDRMSTMYAILSEGVVGAEAENRTIRETLLAEPTSENTVKRLQATTKKRELDEHIQMLEMSSMDTKSTLADLATSSIRIKNMKDANESQIVMVRELRTRGVASVADRLSTVINAVSSAAINEANMIVGDNLRQMSAHTDLITQSESMRLAMGIGDRAISIGNTIDDLISFGNVQEEATSYTRQVMADLRNNLDLMEEKTREVFKSVEDARSAVADVVTNAPTKGEKPSADTTANPFSF